MLSPMLSAQLIGTSDVEVDGLLECARGLMASDRSLLVPAIGALSEASLPPRCQACHLGHELYLPALASTPASRPGKPGQSLLFHVFPCADA